MVSLLVFIESKVELWKSIVVLSFIIMMSYLAQNVKPQFNIPIKIDH